MAETHVPRFLVIRGSFLERPLIRVEDILWVALPSWRMMCENKTGRAQCVQLRSERVVCSQAVWVLHDCPVLSQEQGQGKGVDTAYIVDLEDSGKAMCAQQRVQLSGSLDATIACDAGHAFEVQQWAFISLWISWVTPCCRYLQDMLGSAATYSAPLVILGIFDEEKGHCWTKWRCPHLPILILNAIFKKITRI